MKRSYYIYLHAFTLVELIVVITILAILATIGFFSFQGFSTIARDSGRMSDLNIMSRVLEYTALDLGFYPSPDDSFNITHSGSVLWEQGVFGAETQRAVKRISEIPLDPVTESQYQYAVTPDRQEYELGALMEGDVSTYILGVETTHAYNPYVTYIKGNYNKKIISLPTSDSIHIFGAPTLIVSTGSSSTIGDIFNNNEFAILGSNNLPVSYSGALGEYNHTGALSFTAGSVTSMTAPMLFSGSLSTLSGVGGKLALGNNLRSYYTGSNISGYRNYNDLGGLTTNALKIEYINNLIKGEVGRLNKDIVALSEYIETDTGATYPADTFVSIWDSLGTTTLTVPIFGSGTSANIYYEKVTDDTQTGAVLGVTGTTVVNLPSSGKYRLEITGSLRQFSFNNSSEAPKIESVIQWGDIGWTNMSSGFYGATNLLSVPNNNTGLEGLTDFSEMFRGAISLNSDLTNWDTSGITNMSNMFWGATAFNGDLSNWDTSGVLNMLRMFESASSFNADISDWDTSSVTNMYAMFRYASDFNSDISGWNVSSVEDMRRMFQSASDFSGDISSWTTTSLTYMTEIFHGASLFTSDLNLWNISGVIDMSNVFNSASSFNGDISDWNVSGIVDMNSMFRGASNFNGDISGWNVTSAEEMQSMFRSASDFNIDISSWTVGGVTNMNDMFRGANSFSQDLSGWDVSSVGDVASDVDFDNNQSGLTPGQYPIW